MENVKTAARCSLLWFRSCYQRFVDWARPDRRVALFLVFWAMLLDNMLLTVVVPIIPDYLYGLEHPEYSQGTHHVAPSTLVNHTFPNGTTVYRSSDPTDPRHRNANGDLLPEDIMSENAKIGWLFGSKAIVQLIAQPFIGRFINRVGYTFPLFLGFLFLLLSSIIFAFAGNYGLLFIARCFQGFGTAFTATAGLGLVADKYPEEVERSRALGIALGGTAVGVLFGYPCGSLLYDFWDTAAPFLLITFLLLILGGLQYIILQPSLHSKTELEGTGMAVLMRDKYVLICAGSVCVATLAMATLEATLPIWITDTMHPPNWQLGLVFLPDSFGYLLGTNLFGVVALKLGRWICALSAMLLVGSCLVMIPFSTEITHLVVPHFGVGLGIGIVDSSVVPFMAHLMDTRYNPVYGTVYAINQIAVSLAYGAGPALGGQTIKGIGFPWVMRIIAIINIVYSPLCLYLRDPSVREEDMAVLPSDRTNPPLYMKDMKPSGDGDVDGPPQSFTYQRFRETEAAPGPAEPTAFTSDHDSVLTSRSHNE